MPRQGGGRGGRGGYRLYMRTPRPAPAAGGAQGAVASDPARFARYDEVIREASRLYIIPEALIRAVILVESNFSPGVTSHMGAQGLMQLMPATARRMAVQNPFDPRQNILGGTRYLRWLANMFNGDIVLTIAGYNAGEQAVARYNGIPPFQETQGYVQRVLRHYYSFKAQTGTASSAPATDPVQASSASGSDR
ncbi:MAG: lytic transglycosylase domain-containing protein [Deltaproteobacteria bacterium]|nr:lytic transglycosylase domain-containing protein [Deltaproteobacteria bacterium]